MSTALIWAAVVVSGWYWIQTAKSAGLRVKSDAPSAAVLQDRFDTASLARLLGASPPKDAGAGAGPVPSDRFVLSGLVARSNGQGAALIAVDGKPARTFVVGSELAPGYVLVAVTAREALLAEGLNSPVRAALVLPLQGSAPPSAALQGITSTTTSAARVVTAPAASAPIAPEQISPVPARADARRQPQTSLQRQDRRAP